MATCSELQAQLAPLAEEWVNLTNEVTSDQGNLRELESEAGHVNPQFIANAKKKLADDQAKLQQIADQVEALRQTVEDQHCLFQPQQILEIQFTNPGEVKEVDPLFAQNVVYGKQDPSDEFGGPFPSLDAEQEWKQVLPADLSNTADHNEDYERSSLVGATGWVLNPEFSGGDVPFDHPFGFDWEFMLALDQPAGDPKRYTFLLTPADQSCDEEGVDEAIAQANDFKDPLGNPIIPLGPDGLPNLLGVEIDGGLVPQQFSDWRLGGVDQGDRMAVFGRWIVDCGHQVPITKCDKTDVHPGENAFRTEIHPPLLMADAKVTTSRLAAPAALNARQVTRVLFTSRPYLVSQRFTTDTGNIYRDDQPDDGTFVPHMLSEVVKVNDTILGIPTSSIQVEAHPKIKSSPFLGPYELHLIVRPPDPQQTGPGGAAAHGPLAVAFQFTVRTGCWVEVVPSGSDAVEVVITMDQSNYTPPQLPTRNERTWTRDELGKLNTDSATGYLVGELISVGIQVLFPDRGGPIAAAVVYGILDRGILTDEYDTSAMQGTNLLDSSHALSALASSLSGEDARAQLAALIKERDALTAEVASDEGNLKELQSEGGHVNPVILNKMRTKLATDQAKLKQVTDQVNTLLAQLGLGVLENDLQPFPVYGWLEAGYLSP